MGTIAEWPFSNTEGARKLHEALRTSHPDDAAKLSEKSLATKIGELRNRKLAWWEKRPHLLELFATTFGLEPASLREPADIGGAGLMFAEFPALPALSPSEMPCRLAPGGGLFEYAMSGLQTPADPRFRGHWFVAPPGAGKSLVIRWLQQFPDPGCAVATLPSLDHIADLASSGLPVVVEVERRGAADVAAMQRLRTRQTPVVVLAAHGPPGGAGDRIVDDWSVHHWHPPAGWRSQLLGWVAARLDASPHETWLDTAVVADWLAANDPDEMSVATPGDLLALCADFNHQDADDVARPARARRWIDRVGVPGLPIDVAPTWARQVAGRAIAELAAAHVEDVATEYGDAHTEDWERYAAKVPHPSDHDSTPGPAMVVGHLIESGLLRSGAAGLILYPRWVAVGLAEASLRARWRRPAEWGALAADGSRQALIDLALDALDDAELNKVAKAAASVEGDPSIAQLGAIEAVLAAAGRRIAYRAPAFEPKDAAVWQRLVAIQVQFLRSDGHPGTAPFTRRRTHDDTAWIVTSWALSRTVRPPTPGIPVERAWMFPGWAKSLDLREAAHLNWVWGGDDEEGPAGLIERWAVEFAAKCVSGSLPDALPSVLVPAVFILALDGRWRPTSGHLDIALQGRGACSLAREGRRQPEATRIRLAKLVWELVGERDASGVQPVAMRIRDLVRAPGGPELGQFVLEYLDATTFTETVRERGLYRHVAEGGKVTGTNADVLKWLPERLRRPALEAWLTRQQGAKVRWTEVSHLEFLLAREDSALLVGFVAQASEVDTAVAIAQRVWDLDAEAAGEALRATLSEGLDAARPWIQTAPRSELPTIAGAIGGESMRPDWVRTWAAHKACNGGLAAAALWRIGRS
ncbi:MAG: hypothetical protein U1F43_35235 [Myxococcota bacterium]